MFVRNRQLYSGFKSFFLVIAVFFLLSINSAVYPQTKPTNQLKLPDLAVHPLPPTLAQWQAKLEVGDYFAQIKPSKLGYLIWSQLPIKIYLEPLPRLNELNIARYRRLADWQAAVQEAIAQWNIYLPLTYINQPESADILIFATKLINKPKINSNTGLYDIPRAQAAQTSYKFYLTANKTVAQRMTIQIDPGKSKQSILATTVHELGHALGIWGHSPYPEDALYPAQVPYPQGISARDINTLKKIYQQPTQLGWRLNS
ncbi:MAG: peptidase [Cyanobacteria bacterium J083]|nr:MAG: peptidase [Cyanobacteria bacterium J083]